MAAKFVCVNHDTPLLMPPDLREWVPEDHLVHFIMEAVGLIDLREAKINERGTGSRQYPPALKTVFCAVFRESMRTKSTNHLTFPPRAATFTESASTSFLVSRFLSPTGC